MRIPNSTRWDQANLSLQAAGQAAAKAQLQLATGKKLHVASDDPTGAVVVTKLRAEIGADEAYKRATSDARTWLNVSESALQTSVEVLSRARELAIAGANETNSPTSRDALAAEIEELRDQLVALSNTQLLGRPVFGGFADAAVTFDGTTATFVGDGGDVRRRIDSTEIVTVSVDGAAVFGFSAADDVFTLLTETAAAIRAGDSSLVSTNLLARIEQRSSGVLAGIADLGARTNFVERQEGLLGDRTLRLSDHAAQIESVDFAEAATELARTSAAYEAALAATARLNSMSLLDFL